MTHKNKTRVLSLNRTIQEIENSIKKNSLHAPHKIDKFVKAFDNEFPENSFDRIGAEAITWALMDTPVILYILGRNGPVIIELYGILETFSKRDLLIHFPVSIRETIETKYLNRANLKDYATFLYDLKIWNEEDIKFIEKLSNLRNGVAHKNPKLISNIICSGKKISHLDIDSKIDNLDCVPMIIKTIHVLNKLAKAKK